MDDLAPAGEGPPGGDAAEEEAAAATANQMKIRVSKGAAAKGNPESLEDGEAGGDGEGDGEDGDEFEDEAEDEF